MAHIVFLLHGMGKPEDGWEQPVVEKLKELYGSKGSSGNLRYPNLAKNVAFETRITPVAIRYDHIFERILDRWKADPGGLEAEVVANSDVPGWYEDLTEQLADAADSDEFFWTHAFDVLLYRLSPMVRQEVKNHVAQVMAEGIMGITGGMGNWSAIGYSLGTCVLHDALHMLFTADQLPNGQPTGFDETQAQANGIIMLSNVSRVLQTEPKVLSDQSTVRPGYGGQEGHGCRRYLNVFHNLDPFSRVKRFDPVDWPDEEAVAERRYVRVRVNHLSHWNAHSFLHYLDHPRVHAEIFRAIEDDYIITDAQIEDAISEFPTHNGFTETEWVEIRQAWEDLFNFSSIDGTVKAFKVLREAYEQLEQWASATFDNGDDENGDGDGEDGNGEGENEGEGEGDNQ